MPQRLYTKNELNRIFSDIPSRTLRSWIEADMVEWAGERKDGRGVHRLFATWNLYQIGIVRQLASLHFPLSVIKELMNQHFKDKEDGEPKILRQINDLLIIAMFEKKRAELFPYYHGRRCSKKDMSIILNELLTPSRFADYFGDDGRPLLMRRGTEPPTPEAIFIINLPEIVDKVRFLIENAGLT